MHDRLVTLVRTASSAEAHIVRGRLAAEGIDAFVADDTVADSLSYIGTALGGVKVNVRESDYEQACAVLTSLKEQNDPGAAGDAPHAAAKSNWKCPQCGERVPWGFDLCWSCGTPAADEKVPVSEDEPAEECPETVDRSGSADGKRGALAGPPESDFRDMALTVDGPVESRAGAGECPACGSEMPGKLDFCPACGAAVADAVNPYRYTGGAEGTFAVDPPLPTASEEVEQIVARAFRASVIGLVLCPPLVCPYAMCLLIYVALQGVELSSSGNRKYYAALFLNLLIGIPLACLFVLYLLGVPFGWLAV